MTQNRRPVRVGCGRHRSLRLLHFVAALAIRPELRLLLVAALGPAGRRVRFGGGSQRELVSSRSVERRASWISLAEPFSLLRQLVCIRPGQAACMRAGVGEHAVAQGHEHPFLDRGYPAMITTTASGSTSDIRWIQAGIEYMIRGPSLTKSDCIRFANALILSVQSNS